jgi:hypothetical protein
MVRRALQKLNLKRIRIGKINHHEKWIDSDGKIVEFAKRGHDVPDAYIYELAWQLEKKGIFPARSFKRLLRVCPTRVTLPEPMANDQLTNAH